jgi:hypothetical protein
MPSSGKDRLAAEAMERWADFQEVPDPVVSMRETHFLIASNRGSCDLSEEPHSGDIFYGKLFRILDNRRLWP